MPVKKKIENIEAKAPIESEFEVQLNVAREELTKLCDRCLEEVVMGGLDEEEFKKEIFDQYGPIAGPYVALSVIDKINTFLMKRGGEIMQKIEMAKAEEIANAEHEAKEQEPGTYAEVKQTEHIRSGKD